MLLGRAPKGFDLEFAVMATRVEGALDILVAEKDRRVESRDVVDPFGKIYYRAQR